MFARGVDLDAAIARGSVDSVERAILEFQRLGRVPDGGRALFASELDDDKKYQIAERLLKAGDKGLVNLFCLYVHVHACVQLLAATLRGRRCWHAVVFGEESRCRPCRSLA